jgi:hypothetical protein
MKVYEGARGLDGAIVIVDGKPLPPLPPASPHLGGIRPGTDGSNPSPSSGESCANRGPLRCAVLKCSVREQIAEARRAVVTCFPRRSSCHGSAFEAHAGQRQILGCPGAFRCSWHAVLALKVRTARHQIRQNGFVTSWSASARVSPISRSIRSLNEASTARLILRRRHSRSALRTSLGARSSTRRRPAERPMEIARHPNDARRA